MPQINSTGTQTVTSKDPQMAVDAATLAAKSNALQNIYGKNYSDLQVKFSEPQVTVVQTPNGYAATVKITANNIEVPANWSPGDIVSSTSGKIISRDRNLIENTTEWLSTPQGQPFADKVEVQTFPVPNPDDGIVVVKNLDAAGAASAQGVQTLEKDTIQLIVETDKSQRAAAEAVLRDRQPYPDWSVASVVEKDGKIIVRDNSDNQYTLNKEDAEL